MHDDLGRLARRALAHIRESNCSFFALAFFAQSMVYESEGVLLPR